MLTSFETDYIFCYDWWYDSFTDRVSNGDSQSLLVSPGWYITSLTLFLIALDLDRSVIASFQTHKETVEGASG